MPVRLCVRAAALLHRNGACHPGMHLYMPPETAGTHPVPVITGPRPVAGSWHKYYRSLIATLNALPGPCFLRKSHARVILRYRMPEFAMPFD